MYENEKRRDLITVLNELQECLEETGKEVIIEFKNGKWELDLMDKNKQVKSIQNPDDAKLSLDDELRDLYEFTSSLPENVRE